MTKSFSKEAREIVAKFCTTGKLVILTDDIASAILKLVEKHDNDKNQQLAYWIQSKNKVESQLAELKTEEDRLHKSIIDIAIKGTDKDSFKSIPETVVAQLKSDNDELKREVVEVLKVFLQDSPEKYEIIYAVGEIHYKKAKNLLLKIEGKSNAK